MNKEFSPLDYLNKLVVEMRIKVIAAFVLLFLITFGYGFYGDLIPLDGFVLFNIIIFIFLSIIALSVHASENRHFLMLLGLAKSHFQDAVNHDEAPSKEKINEFIDLAFKRYRAVTYYKLNYKKTSLDAIHRIDRELDDFVLHQDEALNFHFIRELSTAMEFLYEAFDAKDIFSKNKYKYYKSWVGAQRSFEWNKHQEENRKLYEYLEARGKPFYSKEELMERGFTEEEIDEGLKLHINDQIEFFGLTEEQQKELMNYHRNK
ncbi:hypothetical protein NST36_19080 [Bacillus sp. FSL R5-0293]|uniref:hypothetical protein n=1 Tax=Bacillus sp. FSL R5-0293 TaxID=2954584 RepID=UPI0030F71B94